MKQEWPKIRAIQVWLWSWWAPPKIDDHPAYKLAIEWTQSYKPTDDKAKSYALALDYAWKKYHDTTKITDVMDNKADIILRTSGAIAPVLVAALTLFKAAHPLAYLPCGVCIGVSLFLAAACRRPVEQRATPSIKATLEDADDFGDEKTPKLAAHLVAAIHCADVARDIVNGWKSRLTLAATTALCLGVVLLSIPFYIEITNPTPAATLIPAVGAPAAPVNPSCSGACNGQKAGSSG